MTRPLCLITGASAGIGAAFAKIYAGNGFDLVLTGRREDRLESLAEEVRLRAGVEAFVVVADLTDPDAPDKILAAVEANGRHVDVLVNNAGYGVTGDFGGVSWDDHAAFIQVMMTAPCELARKVLPGMIERNYGRILNVASVAGLWPGTNGATLYGPVKAFLIRFSQGLHNECRRSGVHVTALCPGFTYSEFHDISGSRERVTQALPEWMWLGAEEVAAAGYEAAEANRPVCTPGAQYQLITALLKLVPDEWMMTLARSGRARIFGR